MGTRLVVVGDTLLDSDVEGTVQRLCPDAPVPVVDLRTRRLRPGGAGLAALLAARAGHQVVLVTALGVDPAARLLTDLLAGHVEVVRLPLEGATVCKTRIRAGGRTLLRVDSGDGRAAAVPAGRRVQEVLRDAAAVLVSDYGRGLTADRSVRGALAESVGVVPVVWDPHPLGAPPVPGCRLASPNETEAIRAAGAGGTVGMDDLDVSRAAVAAKLRLRWGCDAVALTLGARGAMLATAESCRTVPVPEVAVSADCDTCGAGDAFAAAVTGALLEGGSVAAAVTTAVSVAAQFVVDGAATSVGTVSRDLTSIAPISGDPTPRQPALGDHNGRDPIARLRGRGGRLVATGGCFDLLHPGHLGLLRQARAQGDSLVVCLNSDESVRRLKGPGRPIVPVADRIAMLEALEPVDAVTVFDADTPVALLETLRPDVWVKGGDYTIADLPEAPVVARYGGHTVIIPLLDGYSTSRIISAVTFRQMGRWS